MDKFFLALARTPKRARAPRGYKQQRWSGFDRRILLLLQLGGCRARSAASILGRKYTSVRAMRDHLVARGGLPNAQRVTEGYIQRLLQSSWSSNDHPTD